MDLMSKINVLKASSTEYDDDDDEQEDINNEDIVSIHPFFVKFYDKRIENLYKQSTLGLLKSGTLFRIKVALAVELALFFVYTISQFLNNNTDAWEDTVLVWTRFGLSGIIFVCFEGFIFGVSCSKGRKTVNEKKNSCFNKLFLFVSLVLEGAISVLLCICSTFFADENSVLYSIGLAVVSSHLRLFNEVLSWEHHMVLTIILVIGLSLYELLNITEEMKKASIWALLFWVAMTLIYLYAARKLEIWRRFFNVLLVFFDDKNSLAHHNEKVYYTFIRKMFPFPSLPRALKKSTYNKVFQYEERTKKTNRDSKEEEEEEEEAEHIEREEEANTKVDTKKNEGTDSNTVISVSNIAESSIQKDDTNEQQSISMSLLQKKEEEEEDTNETSEIGLTILTAGDTDENTIFGIVNFDIVVVEGVSKGDSPLHKEFTRTLQRAFSMFCSANQSLCNAVRVNGTGVCFVVDPTALEDNNNKTEPNKSETKHKRQKKTCVTDKQRKAALNSVIELFRGLLKNKTTLMDGGDSKVFKSFRVALVQGTISGGVIDPRRPSLDIWGDTFNAAYKLLKNCPQDSVMVSGRLAHFVSRKYSLSSLKIDEKDITIASSRVVELSGGDADGEGGEEEEEAYKEAYSESSNSVGFDDVESNEGKSDSHGNDSERYEEDSVSSISTSTTNTDSSESNDNNSSSNDKNGKEGEDEEDNADDEKEVSSDTRGAKTDTELYTQHSYKSADWKETEKTKIKDREIVESQDDALEGKIVAREILNGKRALLISQRDYDKGYYKYTRKMEKIAARRTEKHMIDEVKDIYLINKATLRYKNKDVENNWDVHYATVIYRRSVSSVLLLSCFLTSFASSIYDNTFISNDDKVVYTSFVAPFCWLVPFVLSLPAICNCYHNLVNSFVMLAAVAMNTIIFVFVKLDLYTELPVTT